jgi:hypothetical protein
MKMVKENTIVWVSCGLIFLSLLLEAFEPGCAVNEHELIFTSFLFGMVGMISVLVTTLVSWIKEKITRRPE